MTKTLLIKNARVVVTMDDARREIDDGAVFVRGNVIEAVGPSADLPQTADGFETPIGRLSSRGEEPPR